MTAFWQWWPARCRTRHSSFSSWLCLRITWKTEEPNQTTPNPSRDGEEPRSGFWLPSTALRGDLGGQNWGGSHGCIHPRGLWGAGEGDVPGAGAAGADVLLGMHRGWEAPGSFPGRGRCCRFLLASHVWSILPWPPLRGTSSSPRREGTGSSGTPGRAPRGNERRGAGTHPLGDGAAPGALPLLPRVDDLLDADGLALLAVPAGGRASAMLTPTTRPSLALVGRSRAPAHLTGPHSPSGAPTHPHGTLRTFIGPHAPSQNPTGPHSPPWDPVHLHKTPRAPTHPHGTLSTSTGPHSPSQDPTGPH